jgi:hypothetical protein
MDQELSETVSVNVSEQAYSGDFLGLTDFFGSFKNSKSRNMNISTSSKIKIVLTGNDL